MSLLVNWHIGATQRCNKLTRATSRTGLYKSGVFTTLEVNNSGVFTTLGFYAATTSSLVSEWSVPSEPAIIAIRIV